MTSRWRHPWIVLGLSLSALLGTGEARGSFECLPGPTPGGLADWAGRDAFCAQNRHGWSGCLALGRPASLDDLGWSHALARWEGSSICASGEGFVLGLDDLYRESLLGIWVARGGISVGLRRWQVDWADQTQRSGWTISGQGVLRYRQIEMRLVTQDLRLGGRDPAGPEFRFGATAGLRLHTSLALEGGLFRSRAALGFQGALLWSPFSTVAIHQMVRLPDQMLQSGLEFDAGPAVAGVWLEPTPRLGLRVGVTCSFRGRSGGRR